MAGSHDRTCPRDLLQEIAAGTRPLMCADLYNIIKDLDSRNHVLDIFPFCAAVLFYFLETARSSYPV